MSNHTSILRELKTKKSKVGHILANFPDTRNSDSLLIITYWKLVEGAKTIDDVLECTKAEVIRRLRQKWNEEGMYLPNDPEVIKMRRLNAQEVMEGIYAV